MNFGGMLDDQNRKTQNMDEAQKRTVFVEKYGTFAEGLKTSRSSVSTATKLLIQWDLLKGPKYQDA